jgi:hypothetical protein
VRWSSRWLPSILLLLGVCPRLSIILSGPKLRYAAWYVDQQYFLYHSPAHIIKCLTMKKNRIFKDHHWIPFSCQSLFTYTTILSNLSAFNLQIKDARNQPTNLVSNHTNIYNFFFYLSLIIIRRKIWENHWWQMSHSLLVVSKNLIWKWTTGYNQRKRRKC